MADELTLGTRIYRPARVTPRGGIAQVVLDTPAMQHFDDGTVMLRAVPDEALAPDWKVAPWDSPGGRVCVCDEPIPDNWTYFEVFFTDVNFVAVSPVMGDWEELQQKHLKTLRRPGR